MNKLFYLLIFLILSISITLAEDSNMLLLQNTECSEYSVTNSEYELTYEEKMEIASSYFESEINKNEQAKIAKKGKEAIRRQHGKKRA